MDKKRTPKTNWEVPKVKLPPSSTILIKIKEDLEKEKAKKKEPSTLNKLLGFLFFVATCTGFSFVFIGLNLESSIILGFIIAFIVVNNIKI
jgi:hypothetical protein